MKLMNIMENENLYKKNSMNYIKVLDYASRIGMVGSGAGVVIGSIFKIPDLANWSAFVGVLCIGYQTGKLTTENSFEKSKLEKDVKNDS